MRRSSIILFIFLIIIAIYDFITLLLPEVKSVNFWIGFIALLVSLIISGITLVLSRKKYSISFPIEVSITTFSFIYVVFTLTVNILFASIFSIDTKAFLTIHIILTVIFAVALTLMLISRAKINRQNDITQGKVFEKQILIYGFEKIKIKLVELPELIRPQAVNQINKLLEKLKNSDFVADDSLSTIDGAIRGKIFVLSAEVDKIIELKSENIDNYSLIVNEILHLIDKRNLKINY